MMPTVNDPGSAAHLGAAAFHFIPALLWTLIAYRYWALLWTGGPQTVLFRILPVFAGLQAVHYGCHLVAELTPSELGGQAAGLHAWLHVSTSVCLVWGATLFRHAVPLVAVREQTPTRAWLIRHYGMAAIVGAALVSPLLVPPWVADQRWFVPEPAGHVYAAGMLAAGLFQMFRLAQRGIWPRLYDIAFGTTLVAMLAVLGVAAVLGLGDVLRGFVIVQPTPFQAFDMSLLVHTALGVAMAAPFAVVMLGDVVRTLLVAVPAMGLGLIAYGVLPAALGRIGDPELRILAAFAAITGLVVMLGPGRTWLQAAIDRVAFRHSRRCREDLRAVLLAVPLEVGPGECARRVLAAIVEAMDLRGAAILLGRRGEWVVDGDISVEGLRDVWPVGPPAQALPVGAFGYYWIREGALREALARARVVLVVPVRSPRGAWGHLFVSAGLLSRVTDHEHVETLELLADELALLLDASDLLARAVAVERSLAHAEKLAAIGELAARIAHEIRNPVTAARSLAQQLGREPDSPLNGEHAQIIVTELERVERQVRALLRFAKRETFELASVDITGLVQSTLAELRERLDGAGIRVEEDLSAGVMARVDREKIRQVVINLIENAVDALADPDTATKQVRVTVRATNGTAEIAVADSGPGVPADALPRLFEPFFSLKANGTGLGLAIARRTVEAHGGHIHAESAPAGGLTVRIALPQSAERAHSARVAQSEVVGAEARDGRALQTGAAPIQEPGGEAGTDESGARWREGRGHPGGQTAKIEGSR